jgi:hypothetical protein
VTAHLPLAFEQDLESDPVKRSKILKTTALNYALGLVQHDPGTSSFVVFLDDQHVWLPNHLETIALLWKQNSDKLVVSSACGTSTQPIIGSISWDIERMPWRFVSGAGALTDHKDTYDEFLFRIKQFEIPSAASTVITVQ